MHRLVCPAPYRSASKMFVIRDGDEAHLFSDRAWRSFASRSAKNTLRSDWYGTSRRFANTFKSSIIETGRRSEIVRRDGFRLVSFLRIPARHSTYSVESAFAQNPLSSSSLLKSGIFFFVFGIDGAFVWFMSWTEITRIRRRRTVNARNNHRSTFVRPSA